MYRQSLGLTIGIGNSPHVHIPKIPTRTAEARQLILATLSHAPAPLSALKQKRLQMKSGRLLDVRSITPFKGKRLVLFFKQ